MWGFITLTVGLGVLLIITIIHFLGWKIPEGGAPPFAMTLFIGGAQISLVLTLMQMVSTLSYNPGDTGNQMVYIAPPTNVTEAAEIQAALRDSLNAMRNLLVWAMISKIYIVQFLKTNSQWAGPANELK